MARISDIYRRSGSSAKEGPAECFTRLFDPRLVKLREAFRSIGNLGSDRYEANEDAIEVIWRVAREETDMVKHKLQRNIQKRARKKN